MIKFLLAYDARNQVLQNNQLVRAIDVGLQQLDKGQQSWPVTYAFGTP